MLAEPLRRAVPKISRNGNCVVGLGCEAHGELQVGRVRRIPKPGLYCGAPCNRVRPRALQDVPPVCKNLRCRKA
jgi:hypothetical protein